ncbi:MAG: TIGR02594 family protein [Novosphingobium sp.]|nr:TIGR02594 family protein [Novosphingobium sp.]
MTIREIQTALVKAGYRPGPIDGEWGRQTAAAVRAFQKDKGLEIDGIAGPKTLAALAALSAPAGEVPAPSLPPLVWLAEARHLLGLKEGPGALNNPTILEWAEETGMVMYRSDDIAWCGLFVAHCIASTLPDEPIPANPLGARNWASFGHSVTPTRGAIMVFWRKSLQSGLGHVGFYMGEDAGAYCILGGNQADSVSLAWIAKDRFVTARWPNTFSQLLEGPTVLASRTTGLSVNEA